MKLSIWKYFSKILLRKFQPVRPFYIMFIQSYSVHLLQRSLDRVSKLEDFLVFILVEDFFMIHTIKQQNNLIGVFDRFCKEMLQLILNFILYILGMDMKFWGYSWRFLKSLFVYYGYQKLLKMPDDWQNNSWTGGSNGKSSDLFW